MPTAAVATYGLATGRVDPLKNPQAAHLQNVNLVAAGSGTYTLLAGTVLGEVAATPGTFKAYSSTTIANPTTAPTLAAGGADGTIGAGVSTVAYSYVETTTGGETLISSPAMVTLTSAQHIAVTGITPPAGTTVNWYLSTVPGGTTLALVANNAGAGFNILALPPPGAKGPQAVSTASAANDGSQNPKGVLQYTVTVDTNGNIALGTVFPGDLGQYFKGAPMYRNGVFNCADLTGLDAAAVAGNFARLISGTVSAGIVDILGS